MDSKNKKRYLFAYVVCLYIALAGIILGDISAIPAGMKEIFYSNAILITDYVALAGISAAFLNVALVTLFSVILLRINKLPMNGKAIFTIGLMTGFACFGKNIFTMWPIILGSYILSKVCKEPFSKNLIGGLLATSLGPLVGVAYLHGGVSLTSCFYAVIVGIAIGFFMPILAAHTSTLLKGLNLYNGGFSAGLIGLVFVPIMMGFGFHFNNESCWATGCNKEFAIFLYITSVLFIIMGKLTDPEHAFKNFRNMLKRPGIAKDDFTELDGMGAVLINMGVNTIICTTYLLTIGGDFNGATMGGIFTIIGFSANGKHAKNISIIILGVFIGSVINPSASPTTPGIQMGTFLGTTLAPMAGTYGFFGGILAGIFHSFAVLKISLGYAGANLYNNGFCGGIVSVVLYPLCSKFFKANTYSEISESMKKTSH
ncbi:MAG: DUF1576 domain-containing protein [Firmicutes bacterium]|nr:DUF1576 domain-containing protein [Bacillota bacterium]